jgi:PTS system nitrogen regulatory IIA component
MERVERPIRIRTEVRMEVQELLSPNAVVRSLRTTSKKHLLQELAKVAARFVALPERTIFDVLLERERLGTTGVGHGIAIPHVRLAGVGRVMGVFARLEKPIDFDSVDGEPVDLVFMLLAPKDAGADHLKALALVSRLMRDAELCAKLRGCDNADALYALLSHAAPAAAASPAA